MTKNKITVQHGKIGVTSKHATALLDEDGLSANITLGENIESASLTMRDYDTSTVGDYSASVVTGERSISTAKGIRSLSVTTGNYSASAATGYGSTSTATGQFSIASVAGKNSVACAIGHRCKAKATEGSWIVLSERNASGEIIKMRCGRAGVDIEPDTFYTLIDGEFMKDE